MGNRRAEGFCLMYSLCEGGTGWPQVLDCAAVVLSFAECPGQSTGAGGEDKCHGVKVCVKAL